MSSSSYRLTLVPGPQLLYVPGEWDAGPGVAVGEEMAVTKTAHQFLFSPVLVRSTATFLDVLRLALRDPRLVPIFLRFGSVQTCNKIHTMDPAQLMPAPDLAHIRIFMTPGMDLAPVAHPGTNGTSEVMDFGAYPLQELLPLPMEMSTRLVAPHPVTGEQSQATEPHCPELGHLLRDAFAGVQHHRR